MKIKAASGTGESSQYRATPDSNQKIFCIGLNKTATTSLHSSFKLLGIRAAHYRNENGDEMLHLMKRAKQKGKKLLHYLDEYEAFSDYPISKTYKQLDFEYPNSKFILTTRGLESWLKSREEHVRKNQRDPQYCDRWLTIDIDYWKKIYRDHHEEVMAHFKNRSKDLLIINITQGEGWEKLCPFLNKMPPRKQFPHRNKKDFMLKRIHRNLVRTWNKLKINQCGAVLRNSEA